MLLLCVRGECTLRPGTTGQQPTGFPSSSSSPWSSSSSLLVSPVRCTQADQDPDQEFRDNPWQTLLHPTHPMTTTTATAMAEAVLGGTWRRAGRCWQRLHSTGNQKRRGHCPEYKKNVQGVKKISTLG